LEFWKTDVRIKCPGCARNVANPGFNLGCAEWCAYAKECLGTDLSEIVPRKLRKIVDEQFERIFKDAPERRAEVRAEMEQGELLCREREINPLCTLVSLMLIRAEASGLVTDMKALLEEMVNEHGLPAPVGEQVWDLLSDLKGRDTASLLLEDFMA
jgi:uncharacterized protein (UPF0147 family)